MKILKRDIEDDPSLLVQKLRSSWMDLTNDYSQETFLNEFKLHLKWGTNQTMCMLILHLPILLAREVKYIQMELLKHSRPEAR